MSSALSAFGSEVWVLNKNKQELRVDSMAMMRGGGQWQWNISANGRQSWVG